jgi:GTP cyclohydrolase I
MDFEKIAAGARAMIDGVGEDANSAKFADTPRRVASMWRGCFEGRCQSDEELLGQNFTAESYGSFVIVKNIQFSSFCEHHLLPFIGTAAIAYVPKDGTVVGLSKLVRVIDKYSKRLQLQERMTQQILEAIAKNTANDGVLVIISAKHMCMAARGVMQRSHATITRAFSGRFSIDRSMIIEAQQLIFGSYGNEA